MSSDRDTTASFFQTLYGELVSEEARIVLWGKGAGSVWASSIDSAVDIVHREEGPRSRPYFGICLQSPERCLATAAAKGQEPDLDKRRGYAESAMVVPGWWADVDWLGETKKKPYPPTPVAAMELIHAHPMGQPTGVVDSGGGYHAYWLFEEPWVLEKHADLEQAELLSRGFAEVLRDQARARDWVIDSTYDLARVLRVPGTTNEKYKRPVQPLEDLMTWAFQDKFHPGDLEVFLPADLGTKPRPTASTSPVVGVSFTIRPDASPEIAKLDGLLQTDPKFGITWERKRSPASFASGDTTASEYDMALASYFLGAGWTDQQAVDAMVYWRVKHGENEKPRVDYYARTLGRARRDTRVEKSIETLIEIGEDAEEARANGEHQGDEERRTSVITELNIVLNLRPEQGIVALERYPGDPPTYGILTAAGNRLTLGKAEALQSSTAFMARMTDLFDVVVATMKPARWMPLARALVAAVQDVDLGDDLTVTGQVLSWVEEALAVRAPVGRSDETWDLTVSRGRPVYYARRQDAAAVPCVGATWLARWLVDTKRAGPGLDAGALAKRIRAAGGEKVKINYRRPVDGVSTTRWMWAVGSPLMRARARQDQPPSAKN